MAPSPSSLALLALLCGLCCSSTLANVSTAQSEALLAAKALWRSPDCLTSWNSSTDPCVNNWAGVQCGFNFTTVISVNIGSAGPLYGLGDCTFSGTYAPLPASFSALTGLQYLGLSGGVGSSFNGTLPSSWSTLTGLEFMYLEYNILSGTLPATWSTLSQLEILSLSQPYYTGASFSQPYYTGASFSGTLPPQWGSLAALQDLDLSYNANLSGTLPPAWSSLLSLNLLDLEFCSGLTGSPPAAWGDANRSTFLLVEVSGSSIVGPIPASYTAAHISVLGIPASPSPSPRSSWHPRPSWLLILFSLSLALISIH